MPDSTIAGNQFPYWKHDNGGVTVDKDISKITGVVVTKKYDTTYTRAEKNGVVPILDAVPVITKWDRDHGREELNRRLGQPEGSANITVAVIDRRTAKARKYPYDAIKVLQYVWSVAGGVCGKCLTRAMTDFFDSLEAHNHLVHDQRRFSTSATSWCR